MVQMYEITLKNLIAPDSRLDQAFNNAGSFMFSNNPLARKGQSHNENVPNNIGKFK